VAAIVVPVGRAITLRRRAQREVERVFELSLDMISVVGFDGRFQVVNPAFERTLGYSQEQMVGRPFADFVHPDHLDASLAAFAAVFRGDVTQFENRLICADGSERWLEWNARAVPDQAVVHGIARDVTERRRIDAELREARSTAEARGAELHVRAGEQAALRRVATLVAQDASQAEVFGAIADEIGQLLGTQEIRMLRFEEDGSTIVVGTSGSRDAFPLGSRQDMRGDTAASLVLRTKQTARIDDYGTASGQLADAARSVGVRSAVGAPITVEGRLWGAIAAGSTHDAPLPPETESRLGQFTELMATAIANTEARAEIERLADEQAALRRVATLVAEGVQPAELFSAVTQEVERLFLEVEPSIVPSIIRFDPGPEFVLVGAAKPMLELPVGSRWGAKDLYVSTRVLRAGRSARVDGPDVASSDGADADLLRRQGFLYQVGSPIIVEGRLWGAMTMNSTNALPPDTGDRLERFTELVATAIANAESREGLRQLADEQAALRRVAMLVARERPAEEIFAKVAEEVARMLGVEVATVRHFEPDGCGTILGRWGELGDAYQIGTRMKQEGESVTTIVYRTGRSARFDDYLAAREIPADARKLQLRGAVGSPIVVNGRVWGAIAAGTTRVEAMPADAESRISEFTELVATAISNVQARSDLAASRARIVAAADDERRRVVRDLHDGAQQRLVHTIITLGLAQRALRGDGANAESLIGEAHEHAKQANSELRELAHGILPSTLTHGGLRAGVDAFLSRLDVAVQLEVTADRFPAEIEASAYFIVAEALTNVVKHARADHADVRASVEDGMLRLEVSDDGIGGADPDGHGLIGMADRATALGGRLEIASPPFGGTLVAATLPLSGPSPDLREPR
jgi:PAS domain S-box-containing protein